jgi:hypothetical protein
MAHQTLSSEPKRTMVRGGRKLARNFQFLSSSGREKSEAYNFVKPKNFFVWQTLIVGSYVGIIRGNSDYNKSTYWSCQAHKLEPPHLSHPTKLGSIVHSHCFHRLICGYWQFSIVDGKTHCTLNHSTYSICHTKRSKDETTLELHT